MNKAALFIRKITIPPVFAVALLCSTYFIHPTSIGSMWELLAGIFFLAGLPILAYPLQKCIPHFKDNIAVGFENKKIKLPKLKEVNAKLHAYICLTLWEFNKFA